MKATFKHIRMSPQKMRSVVNMVRGKGADEALGILRFCRRRAAGNVLKMIESAVANAKQKGGIAIENLYLKEIVVGQGPIMKRWRARSRGMAHRIIKRSSHISVELEER
ncbi:MAG: 50S ribosomal protein L22 [Deltaproteobacteria bacterium RIFCSPLOWO2_02_FULL_47_10]|nr:MAG: 50S ribosomal protein L22 [Deltaproteobacteria bacterium RIFCSPLOWO2_02_FULL_47_10]